MLGLFVNLPEHPVGFIGLAVKRVSRGQFDQASARGFIASANKIKSRHLEIALREHFLGLAQVLLGLRTQLAVGIFLQESLEFGFGLHGFGMVAVRLFHLAVMRHADLHLRVRGFVQEREESPEVGIFHDGLFQARRAAFLVIGIGDGKLCLGQVFAVRVGVDQGLQGQAGDLYRPCFMSSVAFVYRTLSGSAEVPVAGAAFFLPRQPPNRDAVIIRTHTARNCFNKFASCFLCQRSTGQLLQGPDRFGNVGGVEDGSAGDQNFSARAD